MAPCSGASDRPLPDLPARPGAGRAPRPGRVRRENLELHALLEERSLQQFAESIATYLGLTIGWASVYFTLFLAWGNGRTPGKRLLRLRVVRLDGQPLGLWDSFERFAGYAAGLATGLFGFMQVLWDSNRQGIQDKIAATVVLVESRRKGADRDHLDPR